MKLHVLSDVHLNVGALEPPSTDADAVVVAGDVARPNEAIAWVVRFAKPVFYVAGNHEFYGGSIPGTITELKRLCAGSNVRVLDNDEAFFRGVRFLGTTLWSDFRLFGAGEKRAAAIGEAQRLIRDFDRIRLRDDDQRLFTPADSTALFDDQAGWLERKLAEPHAGPTVVITHHAPSPRSIHPRFADSLLNPCFVSDAERLLDGGRAGLWIHGHTHDSFDYVVNGTRVVCNPRGYARNGVDENSRFDAHLTIDID
ncbi:MAG TPA: metallophosphoesterase [Casimicrobiaceae bacterium]|nr:metallophosphoesterase [Casimicrobiaceae bacterium]